DNFFVESDFCYLCDGVGECRACPVNALYSTSFLGKLPPWSCSINKILRKEQKRYREWLNRTYPLVDSTGG
ncbi:MAG: hypothetical protein GY765_05770, partial [bacterium]|nr:hypothetical protein [bacterium]